MINPIIRLSEALVDVESNQRFVDFVRNLNPANQKLQLEMDRQQTGLDNQRVHILNLIANIAERN